MSDPKIILPMEVPEGKEGFKVGYAPNFDSPFHHMEAQQWGGSADGFTGPLASTAAGGFVCPACGMNNMTKKLMEACCEALTPLDEIPLNCFPRQRKDRR